jgi:general secretion pathway protein D
LEVSTVIEDVLARATVQEDRPTTTKRKVLTNAIVNNGETIILGGLIKNVGGKSVTSVPVLGDIPVLGALFRSKGDVTRKINVVIYLTPYIVRKSGDLRRLRKNLTELEEVQSQYTAYIRKALESKKKRKWYQRTPSSPDSHHPASSRAYSSKADGTYVPTVSAGSTHPASNRIHASESDGIYIPE